MVMKEGQAYPEHMVGHCHSRLAMIGQLLLFYLSGAVNREIEKVESRMWRAKFQSNR